MSYTPDIWALGASIYEIVTGDVPFGQYGGMTQKMNGGKIPPIGQEFPFSEELKQLIYDCLALNTWDRPDANEILERVKRHKDGINPPKTFSVNRLTVLLLSFILVVCCCYIWWPDITRLFVSKPDRVSRVDSIYLSTLNETKSIIENESSIIRKQIEERNMPIYDVSLKNICASFDSYSEVSLLKDSISDKAQKLAILKIDTITSIVDSLCVFFENKGKKKLEEYGDFGKEACDRYMSRKDTLEKMKLKLLTNK